MSRQTTDPAAIAKFAQFGLTPGQNFPGNIIPTGLLNPERHRAFEGRPVPGTQRCRRPLLRIGEPNGTNYREETFRVDHQVGSKLALMGSLLYDNGVQSQAPAVMGGRHV